MSGKKHFCALFVELVTLTHTDSSRECRIFTGICLSVCLSVYMSLSFCLPLCLHDISKTAAARITKLDIEKSPGNPFIMG